MIWVEPRWKLPKFWMSDIRKIKVITALETPLNQLRILEIETGILVTWIKDTLMESEIRFRDF